MRSYYSSKKIAILIFLLCIMCVFGVNSGIKNGSVYAASNNMKVNYIDVGQSDCVLIQQGGKNLLIDAGDVGDGARIVTYLKSKKVRKLDYLIATHPHADHIGGMEDVLDSFQVGKIIMSKKTHTTQTFVNLIKKIEKKGMKITEAKPGDSYPLGKAVFTILAPNGYDYGSNINNYSVSLRMVYKKKSFMFVGDCEKDAIADIMNGTQKLKSDVMMCGHHGSANSTTKEWVKKVAPTYAVISVGAQNSYGHPASAVLEILRQLKIKCFRTDKCGSVVATTNGKKISFSCKPVQLSSNKKTGSTNVSSSGSVYITNSGKKYHKLGCRYLKSSKIKKKLSEAKKEGYSPCKICFG